MDSDKLYRVKKEDIPKLERLLTVCFAKDPLYCKLIPDEDTRDRLLPELPELCQQPVLPSLVQGRQRQIKLQSHLHLIVCLDHPRVLCL